jgi:outer membrane protein
MIALAAVVFGWTPVVAQQAPVRTVTLQEAVDMTLRNSPVMAQRRGAVGISESSERTTVGDFLPSLSFSSGASLASTERFDSNTGVVVSGSSDSYNARLSSSLTLFDAGRRFAARSQAKAQTAQAEANLVEQQFAVTLNAKQAFFNVIRLGENIRVVDANLERAQQTLTAAKQRFAVGSATTSESTGSAAPATASRSAAMARPWLGGATPTVRSTCRRCRRTRSTSKSMRAGARRCCVARTARSWAPGRWGRQRYRRRRSVPTTSASPSVA